MPATPIINPESPHQNPVMTSEERQSLIEAYLDGTLPAEERLRMEDMLAIDPDLARELALHRELQEILGDREWLARRSQLAGLADEFRKTPRNTAWRRLLPLLAVGLGLLALWWMRRDNPPSSAESVILSERTEERPETTGQNDQPEQVITAEDADRRESPLAPTPRHDPFAPHPELEAALQRPSDPELEVEQAGLEQELPGPGRQRLRFRGLLRSAQEPPELQLHLRNNRPASPAPLERLPVQWSPLSDPPIRAFAAKKEWQLRAEATLRLAPGRYYGSLVRADNGKMLWTGTFTVDPEQ
jgi:hypothetical protein